MAKLQLSCNSILPCRPSNPSLANGARFCARGRGVGEAAGSRGSSSRWSACRCGGCNTKSRMRAACPAACRVRRQPSIRRIRISRLPRRMLPHRRESTSAIITIIAICSKGRRWRLQWPSPFCNGVATPSRRMPRSAPPAAVTPVRFSFRSILAPHRLRSDAYAFFRASFALLTCFSALRARIPADISTDVHSPSRL